ncbi:glycosyltransferase family 4 protein [bacterium]|nr:glycosyltransferase family 4 protein [bacterium]MDB4666664.1 glycosyltransferase family 4 protein [bacterium]
MKIGMQERILMLGWEFPPFINGGLGVACDGLTRALTDHVDLALILPETSQLHPYHESQSAYSGDLNSRVNCFTRMALERSKDDYFDIIHAHDWMTFRAGLKIKLLSNKPLVLHIHSLSYDRAGPEVRDWIFDLEKLAMAQADHVITVSEYTKSICIEHYGINPDKIQPIHNGVASITTTPSQPENLVTFLGRMTQQKAPLNFLKIAAKVLKKIPDTRFVMAGTGDQLEEVIQESIRLKINERIQFPGFIDRTKINALFARTSVYCMPSVSEPFGLSALEAAQFSIPTVISKQSGVAEVLTNSRTADHWDLDLMASHITELLQSKEAHAKASEHSSRDHQACTWERSARLVHRTYQNLRPS